LNLELLGAFETLFLSAALLSGVVSDTLILDVLDPLLAPMWEIERFFSSTDFPGRDGDARSLD
jgi:hypothetical protein